MRPANKPITVTGGVVGLKGNLAPDGAIVKVAGMSGLKFTGPERCFDREEACFEAVKKKKYKEGDVLVIRYEGPKGGPPGVPFTSCSLLFSSKSGEEFLSSHTSG